MADDVEKKRSGWWRAVLIVSLTFNFLIVGLVAGAAISGRFDGRHARSFDVGLGPFVRAMSEDDRRAVLRNLRGDRDLRRIDIRSGLGGLVDALRSDPFDVEDLRAAIAAQSAQANLLQSRAQEAVLARIAAMSPTERAAFADRLEREVRRPRGGRSGG